MIMKKTPLLSPADKEWKKLWDVRKANVGLYAGNVKGRGVWRKVTNGMLGLDDNYTKVDTRMISHNMKKSTPYWEVRLEKMTITLGRLEDVIKRKQLEAEICKGKIIVYKKQLELANSENLDIIPFIKNTRELRDDGQEIDIE
tara:strand:+ start:631 stop:1059 length:429 start_codon:yes stop_codon:yes gene_type:complete